MEIISELPLEQKSLHAQLYCWGINLAIAHTSATQL